MIISAVGRLPLQIYLLASTIEDRLISTTDQWLVCYIRIFEFSENSIFTLIKRLFQDSLWIAWLNIPKFEPKHYSTIRISFYTILRI